MYATCIISAEERTRNMMELFITPTDNKELERSAMLAKLCSLLLMYFVCIHAEDAPAPDGCVVNASLV